MTAKEYNLAIDEYADGIFRFAMKHLRNEMSSKDIVQEVFTKVWIKHEEISYEKVKSYLFTSAYHTILDWIKKEGKSGDIEYAGKERGFEDSAAFDLKDILEEALDRLPETQKTVVMLRDYEGYNYAEIAEVTGLTESQVKVYIFRARQSLKEYIKKIELVV
jgi:RNA polymerase sigma factor (sigma-70 family)